MCTLCAPRGVRVSVDHDWGTDYDVLDRGYVVDPYPIWDQLRTECPVARTERWGGSWMPTRYEDIVAWPTTSPISVPRPSA